MQRYAFYMKLPNIFKKTYKLEYILSKIKA